MSTIKERENCIFAKPGIPQHRSWVGGNWDISGAHQLNVLVSLGLRECHYLLDIGCGSLRGARFVITYLLPEHYFGIEPEKWLIEDAIKYEVGQDFIDIKKPKFDYNDIVNLSTFNMKFDYIFAQSILIHAPKKWISKCFSEVKSVLKENGKFIASIEFVTKNKVKNNLGFEWEYPRSNRYEKIVIEKMIDNSGLKMSEINIECLHNSNTYIIVTHKDIDLVKK